MSKKKPSSNLTSKKIGAKHFVHWSLPINNINLYYFSVAVFAILLGYGLMSTGITSDPQKHLETWANPWAIVVGPAVLVISYCVLIPLAILKRPKSRTLDKTEQNQ